MTDLVDHSSHVAPFILRFTNCHFLCRLGEHPVALSVFYSFLVDRFQAADFEGSLTMNILKVCITLPSCLYLLTSEFSSWLVSAL